MTPGYSLVKGQKHHMQTCLSLTLSCQWESGGLPTAGLARVCSRSETVSPGGPVLPEPSVVSPAALQAPHWHVQNPRKKAQPLYLEFLLCGLLRAMALTTFSVSFAFLLVFYPSPTSVSFPNYLHC